MSAERLREAARLMRERAEGVWEYHRGTWTTTPGPAGWTNVRCFGDVPADEFGPGGSHDTFIFHMDTSSTAEHIASWHPAVALAVADWLDEEAEYAETTPRHKHDLPSFVSALAVADAYLRQPLTQVPAPGGADAGESQASN